MLIGVVGPLGSGKSVVVDHLAKSGFSVFRFSDVIVEKGNLKNPTRADYQDWGNKLRKENGTDFLAREIWKKRKKIKSSKIVIDGFRNIGEVEFFRNEQDFYLIRIKCPKKIRFERLKARASSKDPKTLGEFAKMENRDLEEGMAWGQQNEKVMKQADFEVKNNGNLPTLHSKINSVLKSLYESSRKNSD